MNTPLLARLVLALVSAFMVAMPTWAQSAGPEGRGFNALIERQLEQRRREDLERQRQAQQQQEDARRQASEPGASRRQTPAPVTRQGNRTRPSVEDRRYTYPNPYYHRDGDNRHRGLNNAERRGGYDEPRWRDPHDPHDPYDPYDPYDRYDPYGRHDPYERERNRYVRPAPVEPPVFLREPVLRLGGYAPSGFTQHAYALDHTAYNLYEPPAGCRWFRSGSDFVLISLSSGIVVNIVSSY